jgi:myo-inositol-1(or 4)-monophosphatase
VNINISNLRTIGKRLKKEIPPLVWKLRGSSPISKGASGDMTFPIDKKAEEIAFEELEKLNASLTIVSEEYGFKDIKGGGPKLLIDPIDGSKNAMSGITFFSTSIALIEGDTIGNTSIGYVINLVTGDEFWALKNGGSFFNGRPIKTQQDEAFKVIAYETSTPRIDIPRIMPLLSMFNRTRCLGSTALDMAFLSQGAVSVFIMPAPSRSFDFAAGYLLVKEAGGIITDLDGKKLDDISIGVKKASPILASGNEELHRKALEVLRGLY